MSPRTVQIPDMALWSQSIGGLIINFGQIEFQTLRWLQLLGGEPAAISVRREKLARRIKAVTDLIAASHLSAEKQARADELWTEITELSRTRNRIAHNPICVGRHPQTGEPVLSVIDLQQMEPHGDNALEPLDHTQIASTALRAREIARDLGEIIEPRDDERSNQAMQRTPPRFDA
jgi:hypothetical protein